MTPLSAETRAGFAELAEREFGLRFDGLRANALSFSIGAACRSSGMSAEDLLELVRSAHEPSRRILIDALTVGETYFFREAQHFSWLRTTLTHATRRVRMWSAGCATGEEAYSMALLARECLGSACHERVEIWASDVNSFALARARRAAFRPWSFRAMPKGVQARWFREQGTLFELDPEIRGLVRFGQHNLTAEVPRENAAFPGAVDVIFCRNVAPYLSPRALQLLATNLASALAPEGVVICGSTDPPLRSDLLRPDKTGEIYCYRLAASAKKAVSVCPTPSGPLTFVPTTRLAEPTHESSTREAEASLATSSEDDVPQDDSPRRPVPSPPWGRLAPREALSEQLRQLGRNIEAMPFDAELYLARAQLQQELGVHGAAIRDARRALMLDSGSTLAHVLIALSALATRRYSLAIRSVRLGKRSSLSCTSSDESREAPRVLEAIERAIHSLSNR